MYLKALKPRPAIDLLTSLIALAAITLSACERCDQDRDRTRAEEQREQIERRELSTAQADPNGSAPLEDSERALSEIALTGASEPGRARASFEFFRGLMGTRFSVQLIGYDRHAARFAAQAALNEIARVEALVSSWRPDSEIGLINQRASAVFTQVSFETAWLLCASARVTWETSGVFDITWAALKGLWDFRDAVIPPHRQLLKRLRDVGVHQLELERVDEAQSAQDLSGFPSGVSGAHNDTHNDAHDDARDTHEVQRAALRSACDLIDTAHPPPPPWSKFKRDSSQVPTEWSQVWRARLSNSRAQIDLGGIAKGFAVDQAARVLRRLGYRDFLIDGGGDLLVSGRSLNETPWSVGIQHPRAQRAWGRAWIPPGWSVVTSGDYERYFIAARQRYHHIIDLRTGYPAQGSVAVTVFAKSAMIADAYATALFVLGPREGLAVAELTPQLEAVLFTPTGDVLTTSGADLFLHQTERSWRE